MRYFIRAAVFALFLTNGTSASAQGTEWFASQLAGDWGIMTFFTDISAGGRSVLGTAMIRCLSSSGSGFPVISLFKGSGQEGTYLLTDSKAASFLASTDMVFKPTSEGRNLGGEIQVFVSGNKIFGPEIGAVLKNMGSISEVVASIAAEDSSKPDSLIYDSFAIGLNLRFVGATGQDFRILFSSLDASKALSKLTCM